MGSTLLQDFLHFTEHQQLLHKGEQTLLAVSGGLDSMVLCHLFIQAGWPFGIAHCNFQLRGEASDADEAFVRAFAGEHQLPFFVSRFSTRDIAREQGRSVEEAARLLRYEWFEQIRRQQQYQRIATAHHRNDNAETLLFNLFRGTGIQGLHGIRPKRDRLIRPLLFANKKTLAEYAAAHGIHHIEDASNHSLDFSRNYIRNAVIPVVEKQFPEVIGRLNDNIHRFAEAEALYHQRVQQWRDQLLETKGEEYWIPVAKLRKAHPLSTLVYELLKPYGFGFDQSQQMIGLMDAASGKVLRSATHQVLKNRNWLIISPLQTGTPAHILVEQGQQAVETSLLRLSIREEKAPAGPLDFPAETAVLDVRQLAFPLVLRRWKQGDYFYPLGMRKKKKISRFFIDQKVPRTQKEKTWILLSGDRVVWVVGMRIDERFKVRPGTEKVLKITLKQTV